MLHFWQVFLRSVSFWPYFSLSARLLHGCLSRIWVNNFECWINFYDLAAAQYFCLYRGQTRMEYLLEIYAYNCGFYENLRQTLGTRWPLVFISPFISSPLPSDGISFKAFDSDDISKQTKYL